MGKKKDVEEERTRLKETKRSDLYIKALSVRFHAQILIHLTFCSIHLGRKKFQISHAYYNHSYNEGLESQSNNSLRDNNSNARSTNV